MTHPTLWKPVAGDLCATSIPRREQNCLRLLTHTSQITRRRVYGLFGSEFPTGSHKWISAFGLVDSTLRRHPDCDELIVSSSGNTGRACARVLADLGYKKRLTCVVDSRIEKVKLSAIEGLGIRVVQVDEPCLAARLTTVEKLLCRPGTAHLDQYTDTAGLTAQNRITGPWVASHLNCEDLHAVFVPVGTGSALGIPLHLQSISPQLRTFAADPEGSGTFLSRGNRAITGAGADFATPVTVSAIKGLRSFQIVQPSNDLAIGACWWLRDKEHAHVGASSGLAFAAFAGIAHTLPVRAKVLLIFPDGGASYTSTIYSQSWLDKRGISYATPPFEG